MDNFLRFIDITVWPATIVVLSWFFRIELRGVLIRISSLKYKDWEAKFDKGLVQIEEKIGSVPWKPATGEDDAVTERLQRLIGVSPRAAILEAWIELEQVLFELANNSEVRARTPMQIIRDLEERKVISHDLASAFNDLRKLRNDAVHAPDFVLDETEAERFVNLAGGMTLLLAKMD